ncbi:MAG TPA: hypothetical protein VG206_23510 [Terriglobia bacterium]|nr:hypothetical protein [Terriglobia bacterium]
MLNSSRTRTYFWLIALILLSVRPSNAGGPPMVPPGYRLVYNVNGDQTFHLVRALPRTRSRVRFSGTGGLSAPPPACSDMSYNQLILTECSSTIPLLSLTDATTTTPGYLAEIEAVTGPDSNIPLEIVNQATSSGGAVLPSSPIVPAGFGGIDLVQNTAAASLTSEWSPALQFMAQVYTGSASIPDVWYFQNQPPSGKNNPQQVFALVHSATNAINNLTFQVPSGVNIAAGLTTDTNPQLTVGSTLTSNLDLSSVPVTLVGPSTLAVGANSTVNVKAGVTQIWPGFVRKKQINSANPYEGALQVGIALYPSVLTGQVPVDNQLACYQTGPTAAQTAGICTLSTQPMLGVFFTTPGSGDSVVALAPPSRATIASAASHQYNAGDAVCRDTTTPAYSKVIDKGSTGCAIGQAVGIAVGDYTSSTTHAVDLDFGTKGGNASSGTSSVYATADGDLTTGPTGATLCADGSGNITTTGCGTISNTLLTLYCLGPLAAGATLYMFPGATSTACNSATGSGAMLPITFGGTIKNLGVFYVTAPGASQTDTFTVLKCPALASCATTSITCSISGTTTPSTCTDNTDTFSVSAGDAIQITDATGASSAGANPRISIQLQ